jgi:branched-subunit amino acid aminotransferase/4-amino-4-deoxychorismate lyase
MADYTAYFCGQWLPFSQVRIDPLDRGFLVGDCVFDVARTFDGKSFRMREHVDRLYRSLRYVRIDPGLSPDEMEAVSEEVIARNEPLRADVGDFQIWQFVTRGRGRRRSASTSGRWPSTGTSTSTTRGPTGSSSAPGASPPTRSTPRSRTSAA